MKNIIAIPFNKNLKNVVQDFIYGCWCKGKRIGGMTMPPLNHLYIATVLKNDGLDCEFIDFSFQPELLKSFIQNAGSVKSITLLSSSNSFKSDVEFLKSIKNKNPQINTILFGPHPTFMPEYCLREDVVDFVISKEPEFIIRDLLLKLNNNEDYSNLRGIGYKKNKQITVNEPYPFINLDDLPVPDRSLLPGNRDYFNPVVKKLPFTTMVTSRGCAGKCTFCTVPNFYGNKVRYRSTQNVFNEIKYLTQLGYKEIFFRDETFTYFKKRNLELYNLLIDENINLSWIANARVDTIDESQLKLMKQSGCHLIKFGVESGSQTILDNIKKNISIQQTENAFKLCQSLKIDTHAHIMLGCPGENVNTLKETLKFILKLNPTIASFGICTPYPGTPLFNAVAAKHPEIKDGSSASLEKLHINEFYNNTFTSLKKDDLEIWVTKCYRHFYFRPSYLLKRLLSINSLDELYRLIIAGSNIFSFSLKGSN